MTLKPGDGCSFYHEGGSGLRRWVIGWRYGVIRAIPTKGQHKNWVQIEVSAGYKKPLARVWIHSSCVNAPGDCIYHGLTLREEVRERKDAKAKQQAKADRKKRK